MSGPTALPLPPCRVRRDGHGASIMPQEGAATPVHGDAGSRLSTPEGIRPRDHEERILDAFSKGDRVRTSTPRSPRFDNRVGTVVGLNAGEVGLSFAEPGRITAKTRVDAWFKRAELDAQR